MSDFTILDPNGYPYVIPDNAQPVNVVGGHISYPTDPNREHSTRQDDYAMLRDDKGNTYTVDELGNVIWWTLGPDGKYRPAGNEWATPDQVPGFYDEQVRHQTSET